MIRAAVVAIEVDGKLASTATLGRGRMSASAVRFGEVAVVWLETDIRGRARERLIWVESRRPVAFLPRTNNATA